MTLKIIPVMFLFIALSCSSFELKTTGNHENLRRYKNPDINEIIIGGWEHIQKNNYEWGGLDFKRLIQKDYVDYDILFGAGMAHYYQGLYTKSVNFFTRVLEENPEHFEALYYRANAHIQLGNRSETINDFKEILSIEYSRPLVCGLYFFSNDIASEKILKTRKHEARQYLKGNAP